MISQSRISRLNAGVTLIEILVVIIIASGLIAGGVKIMTQFQKWFVKGGKTGAVLQDIGISLACLRHDLLNVVGDKANSEWECGMAVMPDCLSLRTFLDSEGTIAGVDYVYHPDPKGGTLQRIQTTGSNRVLIQQRIASLSWQLASETVKIPGTGTHYRRVWLTMRITLGGHGSTDTRAGEVSLETTFFPKRLNRQLNRKE